MSSEYIIPKTYATIGDFEAYAMRLKAVKSDRERHEKAVYLCEALREAYGDIVGSVITSEANYKYYMDYNPQLIGDKIAEARKFMAENEGWDEMQVIDAFRNPFAGIYAYYRQQGDDDGEAEEITRATIMHVYATFAATNSIRDNRSIPPALQTPMAESLFKRLEAKTARYRGRDCPLLDRSVWPWKPITMNAWIFIASMVKDYIGGTYTDWEAVVGGRNFRQRVDRIGTVVGHKEIVECIEEYI